MKLATLLTDDEGPEVVAVLGDDAAPRFIPLNRADLTLPRTLRGVLSIPQGISRCRDALRKGVEENRHVSGRLLAPIPDPGKVLCVGLNYRDHAIEAGQEIPSEPVCFGKFGNTIAGPGDPIRLPKVYRQVDYEAELVVVIGRKGKDIPQAEAWSYVAGYCNGHDVSDRDWQFNRPGKQWLLGKTPDTFAPIGPWIVTTEDISDPHQLGVRLWLNGQMMPDGNTREFIFGIDAIIAHISQLMTLEPGDIIFTGSPPGVGMGRKPPVWLKPGDKVDIEISGLGRLTNVIVGPGE